MWQENCLRVVAESEKVDPVFQLKEFLAGQFDGDFFLEDGFLVIYRIPAQLGQPGLG